MAPPTAPAQSANGILPASVLQKPAPPAGAPTGPSNKAPPRLKLVIRRLAPGLTQVEFEEAVGEEWKLGGGRVDWMVYRSGKVSRDLAKPSRPSRAYLRLTDQSHLASLSDKVRQTSFIDAKNTAKDAALIGPPSLEHAPYPRVPGGRRRNDARQGLIDQDPEFQEFLESLTNPTAKLAADPAAEAQPQKDAKVTTTPLIEHLREKKAAKDKPAVKAVPKNARQESKDDNKGDKLSDKKAAGKAAKEVVPPDKGKKTSKEKTAREAAKTPNKDTTTAALQPAANSTSESATPNAPSIERRRERGNAAIAARILQRDLGIGPNAGSKRGKREITPSTAQKDSDATASEKSTSQPALEKTASNTQRSPRKEIKPARPDRRGPKPALTEKTNHAETTDEPGKSAAKPPTGPAAPTILKKPHTAEPPPQQQQPPKGPAAARQPAAAKPTTTAPINPASSPAADAPRQAFLKHANPSQGITEALLHTALSAFGPVERVEIDKRKGLAYVDFAEPDGLAKAMAASPVKVAQGAVQVLVRRVAPAPGAASGAAAAAARGGGGLRGRGGRGRGGGVGRGGAAVTTAAGAAPATAPTTAPMAASAGTAAPAQNTSAAAEGT